MKIASKYEPATLPTKEEALRLAEERETWARDARDRDLLGSARFACGRASPVERCYIIDSLAKHAKQLILGPSMIAEGERRIR